MTTLLIAIPLFVLAVVGMALGFIAAGKPPGGSCGNCSNCLVRRIEEPRS